MKWSIELSLVVVAFVAVFAIAILQGCDQIADSPIPSLGKAIDKECVRGAITPNQAEMMNAMEWAKGGPDFDHPERKAEPMDHVLNHECSEVLRWLTARDRE